MIASLLHPDLLGQVHRALLVVLGDRHDVEDVLPPLLPDRARGRPVGDEGHLVALGDVGHRLGDAARVGGEEHVDLVLGDELLVELDGGLHVGLVVEQRQDDLVAEEPAAGVDLVDPELDRVDLPAGRLRVLPGLGDRAAEQRPRCSAGGARRPGRRARSARWRHRPGCRAPSSSCPVLRLPDGRCRREWGLRRPEAGSEREAGVGDGLFDPRPSRKIVQRSRAGHRLPRGPDSSEDARVAAETYRDPAGLSIALTRSPLRAVLAGRAGGRRRGGRGGPARRARRPADGLLELGGRCAASLR